MTKKMPDCTIDLYKIPADIGYSLWGKEITRYFRASDLRDINDWIDDLLPAGNDLDILVRGAKRVPTWVLGHVLVRLTLMKEIGRLCYLPNIDSEEFEYFDRREN